MPKDLLEKLMELEKKEIIPEVSKPVVGLKKPKIHSGPSKKTLDEKELKDEIKQLRKINNELEQQIKKTGDMNSEMQKQKEELKKQKKVIKDLLSNPNKRLLEQSDLKIIGFIPNEFYNRFIFTIKNDKPKIQWINDENINKRKFQETLTKLKRERNLINNFYNSIEWLTRKNEILKRDNNSCKKCKKITNIVHHLNSALYHPELCLDPNNLVSMCRKCEDESHNRNGNDEIIN